MTHTGALLEYLNHNDIFFLASEPMSRHTTFRIGGPADLMAYPTRRRELCELVKLCRTEGIPYFTLGNGSNLLVSDKGIRGLVIVTDRLRRVRFAPDDTVECWCGEKLGHLASLARSYSLSGLEFAQGIPGTVGGALSMNAGAYGHEIGELVIESEYVDEEGQLRTIAAPRHQFGYRTSLFKDSQKILVRTRLLLKLGKQEEIDAEMARMAAARREKQPLELPSAGSVFKRPEGHFAGKLIEDCGLKGARVGGACVSEKHAGFIVNTGGATCRDVLTLIEQIQKTVRDRFGVELEPELRTVGLE